MFGVNRNRVDSIFILFNFIYLPFLDASSHLYKRVCPSVHQSIGLSIGPSVRRSVRWSVRNPFFSNPRKRLFLAAEMDGIELVVPRGEEGGWDGGDEGGRW